MVPDFGMEGSRAETVRRLDSMNKGEDVFLQLPSSKRHPLARNGFRCSSNPFPACLWLRASVHVARQL